MNAERTVMGGRRGRWIGAALLLNFGVVCIIKTASHVPDDILWLSHVGLLVAAIGLLRRSALLVCTALIGVFVLHTVWLVDCITWLLWGTFPLAVTAYLAGADVWAWVSTAHHFYLVPLLVILVWRHGQCPRTAFPTAVGLFACLTILSRAALDAERNVNFAFKVDTTLGWAVVEWVNELPALAYLLLLNVVVSVLVFLPTYLGLRVIRAGQA